MTGRDADRAGERRAAAGLAGLPEHLDRRCRPRCRRPRPSTRRRRPTSCAPPSRTRSRARGSCRDPDTDTRGRRGDRGAPGRRLHRHRPPAGQRGASGRSASSGCCSCAPAVIIMLAVAAYPIIYAFWLSLNKADLRRPNANEFIGFDNYVTVLSSPIWWRRSASPCSSPSSARSSSWCSGCSWRSSCTARSSDAGWCAPRRWCPTAIVTVVAAFSWRFAWTEDLGYLTPERVRAAHRVLAVDLDHHPGRGLEDDPVHGAAADGRPGPGARGPAQGGLDGRRERLEAVLDDHRAADQAGHPGGAAVPHPGRVPGLRQHLRPHQRRQRHQLGVDASPTTT